VIEEVVEMLAPKAEENGIDLVVQYPPTIPRHVIGDAGRIRQVVTNLAANAVKFTAKKSGRSLGGLRRRIPQARGGTEERD
jgi:signal transduction histidine kinase